MRDHFDSSGGGVGAPGITWGDGPYGAPIGTVVTGVLLPVRDPETGQMGGYYTAQQTEYQRPGDTSPPVPKLWDKTKPADEKNIRTQAVMLLQTPFRSREAVSAEFLAKNPDWKDDGRRAFYLHGKEEDESSRTSASALGGKPAPGWRIWVKLVERQPNGVNPDIKVKNIAFGLSDAESTEIVNQYQAAQRPAQPGDVFNQPPAQGPPPGQWGGQPQSAPPAQGPPPGQWAQPQQAPPAQAPAPGQWGGQPQQAPPAQAPAPGQWGGQPQQAPPAQAPPPGQWGGQPADPGPAQSPSGGQPPF